MATTPRDEKFKKCPICENFIPDLATVCMYCGAGLIPAKQKKKGGVNWGEVLVYGVAALILGAVLNNGKQENAAPSARSTQPVARAVATSTPNARAEAIEIGYQDLARYTETYVGKYVYFRGQVAQVAEGSGGRYVLRVAVTPGNYGSWDDYLYVHYRGDLRLLEDDVADFWLRIDGRKTYEALLGNQITVPEATALIVELVNTQ